MFFCMGRENNAIFWFLGETLPLMVYIRFFWWQPGCQCRFKMTSLFLLFLPAKGNHSRWAQTSYTWPGWRSRPLACLKWENHTICSHSTIQHGWGLYTKTVNNIALSLNNAHIYKERCIAANIKVSEQCSAGHLGNTAPHSAGRSLSAHAHTVVFMHKSFYRSES